MLYLGLVGAEAANIRRAVHLDSVLTLVGQGLHDRQCFLDQCLNVYLLDEGIHLPGLDLREVENVVDQPQEMSTCAFDLLQVLYRRFVTLGGGVLSHPPLQRLPVAHGKADVAKNSPQIGRKLLPATRVGAVELEIHHRFAPLLVAAQ